MRFCLKMHPFYAFLSVVHTKMPKNDDENGDLRKRFQKWSLKKTYCFESAFKCRQVKTEAFQKGDEKRVTYLSLPRFWALESVID